MLLFPKTHHSSALALGTTPCFCGTWGPDSVWSELRSPGTWYELKLATGPDSRREDGARGRAWVRGQESHDRVLEAWVPLPLTSNSVGPQPLGVIELDLLRSRLQRTIPLVYIGILNGILTYSFKS